MRHRLKMFAVSCYVLFYRILYPKWAIHSGQIGNRVEISRVKKEDIGHKHFISYPLKVVKL